MKKLLNLAVLACATSAWAQFDNGTRAPKPELPPLPIQPGSTFLGHYSFKRVCRLPASQLPDITFVDAAGVDTPTQRHTKLVKAYFLTVDGEPIPNDSYTRIDTKNESSDGAQPLVALHWQVKGNNNYLTKGVTRVLEYEADMYHVAPTAEPGLETGEGFLGARSEYCSFRDLPATLNWMTGADPKRLDADFQLMDYISKLPFIDKDILRNNPHQRYPGNVAVYGSDCGGLSLVYQAAWLRNKVPTRVEEGYLLGPSGVVDQHARPERLVNGAWLPIDVTETRHVSPELRQAYIGIDGEHSRDMFVLHFGLFNGFVVNKAGINGLPLVIGKNVSTFQHPYIVSEGGTIDVSRCQETWTVTKLN